MGLQLRYPGGEFIGEIGIVVQQLGARVDHGLGAQRRDVVGIVFQHGAERLHGQGERHAALLGILQTVEIEEIGARDLIEHFGVVGTLFALLLQFLAGFGGLAFAQQQQGIAQGTGLFGQRSHGHRVVLLPGAGAHGKRGGGDAQDGQAAADFRLDERRQLASTGSAGGRT